MSNQKKSSRWGIGIAALYSGFALFIIVIVIFASFQHFELTEADYYDKGTAYQQQIDKMKNAAGMSEAVAVAYDPLRRGVVVKFPESTPPDSVAGTIQLYRPSNANLDRTYEIKLDDAGEQIIVLERPVRGLWKVRIDWVQNDIPCFESTDIFVQ